MSTSNSRNNRSVNPDDIKRYISNAQSSLTSYKDSAASAAANGYMVWQATLSKFATSESKKWISTEIETINKYIDEHNKTEDKLIEKAKNYYEGKLPSDDWLVTAPKNPEEKKQKEAEATRLIAIHKRDRKAKQAAKKVKIEAREGTSQYTVLVKYVFSFDRSSQANSVYRFCLALEWIGDHFGKEFVEEPTEIVDAINKAGGFEEILEATRLRKGGVEDQENERTIMAQRHYVDTCSALMRAKPVAKIKAQARFAHDNIVLMVGRYDGTSIDIIGELNPGEGELKRLIGRYEDPDLLPVPETTEFVARVLDLGNLVTEGETASGKTAKEDEVGARRLLTLREGADEQPEFVVSANQADSSVVIYAQPDKKLDLGVSDRALFMKPNHRSALEKKLGTYERRRLIDIRTDHEPKRADGKQAESPMSWVAFNTALEEKKTANASQQFFWSDLGKTNNRPLDIDAFKPHFTASITGTELLKLYFSRFKEWGSDKNRSKNANKVELTHKNGLFEIYMKDMAKIELTPQKYTGDSVKMVFRPKEIFQILTLLSKQHTDEYVLRGDIKGLLEISWADKLGRYRIYLPTVTTDGRLETRRVAPMELRHSDQMAA